MKGLTDIKIKGKKVPDGKKFVKLVDGGGLYLFVTDEGSRLWRMRYKFQGTDTSISFGAYPYVTLAQARKLRDEAKTKLAAGINPVAARKAEKVALKDDFESVAEQYIKRLTDQKPKTVQRIKDRLTKWVYPEIGKHPVGKLEAPDVIPVLHKVEMSGNPEKPLNQTVHRVRSDICRVMRFANQNRLSKFINDDLYGKDVLKRIKVTNFAALTTPKEVGELLRAIDGYKGQPAVEVALKLAPHVFVRPGELRSAEWAEFDLESAEWRIPKHKTKMKKPHLVPLSKQVVRLLKELQEQSDGGRLLFPTLRDPQRCMSENTLNACLRRLGYTENQMTSHGFRTVFSTLARELGERSDLIEKQLAHEVGNRTEQAYNKAEFLSERRLMMQRWSDYLDKLKQSKPKGQ